MLPGRYDYYIEAGDIDPSTMSITIACQKQTSSVHRALPDTRRSIQLRGLAPGQAETGSKWEP